MSDKGKKMENTQSNGQKNRRADAALFGFDFQVNAAIVIMLENIVDLKTLKIESSNEDIEICCNDNSLILAQAKAVVNSESDFSHVTSNLKKALCTLSEGAANKKIKQLIFVTNSINPLGKKGTMQYFIGHSHREYSSLPPDAQKRIDMCLEGIVNPLDKSKLLIQTIPFATDNEEERYKVIKSCIDDFIGELNISVSGLKDKLFKAWNYSIFHNGTLKDVNITVKKKEIVWPIIVIGTEIQSNDDTFNDDFDEAEMEDIINYYRVLINDSCERFSFACKVISDYSNFSFIGPKERKCHDFVFSCWEKYESEFKSIPLDAQTKENLIKVIIYQILRRRRLINQVKKEVNLD